jgi:hypothetical protein
MIEFGEFTHFNLTGTDSRGEPLVLYCSPEETSLYIHSPQFRELDHIFHQTDEENDIQTFGVVIWRHLIGDEAFDEFAQAMVESGNWEYHYLPEPLDKDMELFASLKLEIPESIPNDFS